MGGRRRLQRMQVKPSPDKNYSDYFSERKEQSINRRISSLYTAEAIKLELGRSMIKKTTIATVLRNPPVESVRQFHHDFSNSVDKELRSRAVGLKVRLDRFVLAFFGLCERYGEVFNREELAELVYPFVKQLQTAGYDMTKGSQYELPLILNKHFVAGRLRESCDVA